MKKILFILSITFLISSCSLWNGEEVVEKEVHVMNVYSNDFLNNESIPSKFTCDGENISPHLSWAYPPEGTLSYAISMVDPDAPNGTFIHWMMFNLHNELQGIAEGNQFESPVVQLENSAKNAGYTGPCPPSGTHRYIFNVYALDTELLENVDSGNFFETIETHTIGKGELIGLYERKK